MATPRITVGVPVYKGADLIGKALDCLQRQTFGDFEVIVSVDGNDTDTADACRPYLADPRFRMVVHPGRLDWVGNFNWLLQQDIKEFFCYRQHDDTTAPEFFEILMRAADRNPQTAAIYCDCQMTGGRRDVESVPSIKGEPFDRVYQYIARLPNIGAPVPIRGLVRRAAIRHAGVVRSDEFRAAWQVFGWLANLLAWGDFRRVPEPLYYRLDHARSYTREFWSGAGQAAWTTLFTGLLAAAMRISRTPQERLFFQQLILDRIVAYPPFHQGTVASTPEQLANACLDRLRHEGNFSLFDFDEHPSFLEGLDTRVAALKHIERSRVGRGLHRTRERYRLSKIIYPKSPARRAAYLFRHAREMLGKIGRLIVPGGT
jgi:glycosyltransferase involved in cell wall biosynthesis